MVLPDLSPINGIWSLITSEREYAQLEEVVLLPVSLLLIQGHDILPNFDFKSFFTQSCQDFEPDSISILFRPRYLSCLHENRVCCGGRVAMRFALGTIGLQFNS